jgi:ribosomal protein S18 acetylase RimI-like enzyme
VILEINKFDTQVLDYTVGKLLLPQPDSYKKIDKNIFKNFVTENKIKFIVCSATHSPGNIDLLNHLGFDFVSTKVMYSLRSYPLNSTSFHPGFSESSEQYRMDANVRCIQDMMHELAATSHYAKNLKLPQNTAIKIYTKWFENIFNGNRAEKIFFEKDQNKIIGFASTYKSGDQLFIDQLATHPEHRGHGVASRLVQAAIKDAHSQSQQLYIVTQAENTPANRLYQKHGFLVESFELIFHWIS